MQAGLYSKNDLEKSAWVRAKLEEVPEANVVYIHPKNRAGLNLGTKRVHQTTYEDLTETDNWLRINSALGINTLILLENPSRYPKISSEKVRYLRRLTMQAPHKLIVDIVPFTLAVEYLYTPMAFLGREILGYAHYYAFRENYHEQGADGVTRQAHDFAVLAPKIASVCQIDYAEFLNPNRHTLETRATDGEHQQYAALRQKHFDADMPGPKIVTRLADLSHGFESRLTAALELVQGFQGQTVVLTNLTSYAKAFQSLCDRAGLTNITVSSYQMAKPCQADQCVYLEPPIVKSYYLLDVESWLPEHCTVWSIKNDTKVDAYLWGLLESEVNAINGLTKEVYHVQHR